MPLHRHLFIAVLLLFIFFAFASSNPPAQSNPEPSPSPSVNPDEVRLNPIELVPMLDLSASDRVRRTVYNDVYAILSEPNDCSRFFGGTGSLEALNELFRRLDKKALNDGTIGVSMSGRYGNFGNARTGYEYRIFEKSVLNTDGPFYRTGCFASSLCLKNVGGFGANSREGKILMMLHEMAHLVKGSNGKWLIPDDGDDTLQSAANTRKVETQCRNSIVQFTRRKQQPMLAKQPNTVAVAGHS